MAIVQAHTHGINWELVTAVLAPICTLLAAAIGGAVKVTGRRQAQLRAQLGAQVEGVKRELVARLVEQNRTKAEFQEVVTEQHAELGGRVGRLDDKVGALGERVARLEGPVRAIAENAENGGS